MRTQNKGTRSSRFRITTIAIAVASSFAMTPAWAAPATNPPGNGVGIAIGSGSTTDTYAKKQIAIGVNSKTISDGSAPNDSAIAIGAGAHTYNELGRRVAAVSFGKQHADYTGGIAIGANTYAITTGTSIGQRDYVGAMGDITVSNSNRDILQYAPGATSLGSNAYAGGTLSTVLGAYNIATSGYKGTGWGNTLSYAAQNFGSTIVGTLNTNESATVPLGFFSITSYSGIANSTVGIANRTYNSNGALIFGAGNEITNSVVDISVSSTTQTASVNELAGKLRTAIHDDEGGATLAIGGGNTADYTQASQLIGVNNTLKGSSSSVSQYNALNGYKNTAENVKHVTVIGSSNTVTDGESNIVAGDNHKLTGVSKSVIIGSSSTEKEVTKSNVVVIGQDADIFQEGDVALGSGSTAAQVEATTNITIRGTSYDFAGTSPTSTVSVGSEGKERTITNVAAGRISAASTDAINGSQLFAVTSALDTLSTSAGAHYYSVKSSNTEADSNYDNDGATGTDSIVLGISSKNSGNNSTVIGNMNSLTGIKNGVNNSIVVGQRLEVDGTHNAVFGTDYGNYDNKLTKVAGEQNTVIGVGNLVGYTAVKNGTQWTYTKRGDSGSDQNVAVGLNNTANGGSIAVGTSSVVDSLGVSLGHANTVIGPDDTGTSGGQWGVAIGNKLTVSGENAVAVGTESTAKGDWTVAVGSNASTEKTSDIAIGTQASATGGWSTVLGASAKASAQTSTALGYKAEASVSNGVALGSYSVAKTEAGVAGYDLSTGTASTDTSATWKATAAAVSVGNVANNVTRQITGVAAGSVSANSTDAVNGSQLYQTNQAVQQNADDISKLYNRSAELNRKIHRAGAHAAALAALHPLDFDENHRVSASLGLGQYHSSGAAALGIFVRPTENFMVSLGGSIASGSDVMGNLGVHYRFGGDSVRVNKTELTQQVSTLTAENRDLSAKLASSNSKLEAATSKIDSLMERIHAIEAKLNMK